jgi:arginase family enzyme
VDAVIAEARRLIDEVQVYKSFDLDFLDPEYSPAVVDPETGGASISDTTKFIRSLRRLNITGSDIVCFAPRLDATTTHMIALNASTIFYELVTIIADSLSSSIGMHVTKKY